MHIPARRLNFFLAILPLISGAVVPAVALDLNRSMTQYAHRIWGQEEGLFQPTIYSVLQTRDGFLWLGTQDSLIRFDGIHFREFADGASVLHGTLVHSLVEDRDGNLWAGTLGRGVVQIDRDGDVKAYSTRNGLPSDSVFGLSADKDGAVWACTTEGLVRISTEGIRVFTQVDGLPSKRIRTTCETNNGVRWVAAFEPGFGRFEHGRFTPYVDSRITASENVTALDCGSDGSVWVGTADGVLHLGANATTFYDRKSGLPDNEVSSLVEGKDGTLWIGTNDGISRLHNGEISVYSIRDGLSHTQVLALCFDREGTLWAGTKNGLDQFTDGQVIPYTVSEGLPTNDVGPVLEDGNGQLWIGTLGHGLERYDGRKFHALTTHDGLLNDTVLSLAMSPSGDLWVGTESGINRIRNGRITEALTQANGLRGNHVRSLLVDAQGTLWAGTDQALQRLNGSRLVGSSPPLSDKSGGIVALSAGHAVRLFASGSDPALYVMRQNELTPYPLVSTHPVDCFFLDPRRSVIWMGTLGSGLLRWKNDAISHVYVKDGLYDNRIYSMLEDDSANFWIASSKGIFRLSESELANFADAKTKAITSLPFSTGQLRFECRAGVQPAACRTSDGRLWFSTTNGLVVLDPNHLHNARVPPPVAITAMLVDGKRLPSGFRLHLKAHETNNVEIRYAGLSFISPEKVTFRYKLDGYQNAWTNAGVRREAFYTNLPPGNFDFEVQARSADGVWSRRAAFLRFTVDPKIYQRRWFFPLIALLVLLAALAGYRLWLRRLNQRFGLVLAERSRIARELHDTLLQGLSGITMQLQALWTRLPASSERESLGEIIADAGRCSAEARHSLWGLRPQAPVSLSFSEKLERLANGATADRHLSLLLDIESISLANLPEAEYQLLRIAREAIANVLQHAGATCLTVNLRRKSGLLLLQIEDDGIASSRLAGATGHFGLEGMQERAREIGAAFSITGMRGQGTCVTVSLPLSLEYQKATSNNVSLETHPTE